MVKRLAISNGTIEQLLKEQKNKCFICKTFIERGRFHIDHEKMLSKGGNENIDNYQLLCVKCHKNKCKKENIGFAIEDKKLGISVCKYCNMVLEGFNQKQVDYMMIQHKIAKHPDKIKIIEVNK